MVSKLLGWSLHICEAIGGGRGSEGLWFDDLRILKKENPARKQKQWDLKFSHKHTFSNNSPCYNSVIIVIPDYHLIVCSHHVTYAFQSESTFYTCLNVKKLLVRNRCKIWSDSNRTLTHNLLVRIWKLNHFAKLTKWLSCVVSTYLYSAFDCMYGFQSESTLHGCLNVKELLAWNRPKIWSISDCN